MVSALNGARFEGFAEITEAGLCGMVQIRADLASAGLAQALGALGLSVPGRRAILSAGDLELGWMSPDELMLFCPRDRAAAITQQLAQALGGEHAMVLDVSDARVRFSIRGEKADQVLMKLCPVDLPTLPQGEIRRTRAAQTAVAFWRVDGGLELIAFRSVAGYVMGLLKHSARPGAELF